ncbi:MAG: site-specific integrase [Clostridia bacterium]
MYYVEIVTGLRRGELLGLKWSDIDFKDKILRIRRQILRVDGKIVEAPLKTKNSYRNVPIGADAVKILRKKQKNSNSEYVFSSENGGPISPDSVLNMLHRVLERAGLEPMRFHDLRHTFATIALQNGVDIKTVSGMLGHFSAGFTLDTYTHVTTEAQISAANTMGEVMEFVK